MYCLFARNHRRLARVVLRRLVKETIRLTELLLAVLIDGHEAMRSRRALPTVRSGSGSGKAAGGESEQHQRQRAPQATAPSRSGSGHVFSHVVPPEFQRRVIDSIRKEDTRTLLDSIENVSMCSVIVIDSTSLRVHIRILISEHVCRDV